MATVANTPKFRREVYNADGDYPPYFQIEIRKSKDGISIDIGGKEGRNDPNYRLRARFTQSDDHSPRVDGTLLSFSKQSGNSDIGIIELKTNNTELYNYSNPNNVNTPIEIFTIAAGIIADGIVEKLKTEHNRHHQAEVLTKINI